VNPQNWNRYSYVTNRPVNFNDPSGHVSCQGRNWDDGPRCFGRTLDEKILRLGITFDSDWSDREKAIVVAATIDAGGAIAYENGGSAESAFLNAFGEMTFGKCGEGHYKGYSCDGFGLTVSEHEIILGQFYSNPNVETRLVVHELGHAFYNGLGYGGAPFDGKLQTCINPASIDGSSCLGRPTFYSGDPIDPFYGFAGGGSDWQFGYYNTDQYWEIFADMFLGWVYDRWGVGNGGVNRSTFMDTFMSVNLKP
jgi:hypothetical protein